MSGLASFHPTWVGLRTYPSRLGLRLRSMSARSECQDRQASRHSARASGRSRRTTATGHEWRVDREIVFNTAPTGTATFAAPVNTSGTAFESGVPQRLPLPPNIDVVSTPQSSPDGQRFLVDATQDQRAPRTSISVVLNWPALLKQ